jgi:hypothetical protein
VGRFQECENEKPGKTYVQVYKVKAVPLVLYVSKTWTLKNRDWNRIKESVKCCTRPGVGNLRLASHMRLFGCEAAAL